MRRFIAAVLFASFAILLAAGCRMTSSRKSAAARALTSILLNSVFLIESHGHHGEDPGANVHSAMPTLEADLQTAAPELPFVASVAAAESVDDQGTAGEARSAQPSPCQAAKESGWLGSQRSIKPNEIEVVASRLPPAMLAPSPEGLPHAPQLTGALPLLTNLDPLSARFRNAVRLIAMKKVLSQSDAAGTLVRTRRIVQELEKEVGGRARVRVRIASSIDGEGTHQLVSIDGGEPLDPEALSRLVQTSLCLVTTTPSH